jgi:hypothetical protein
MENKCEAELNKYKTSCYYTQGHISRQRHSSGLRILDVTHGVYSRKGKFTEGYIIVHYISRAVNDSNHFLLCYIILMNFKQ